MKSSKSGPTATPGRWSVLPLRPAEHENLEIDEEVAETFE